MDVNNKKTLDELSYRRLRLYSDYRIVNSNHIFGKGALPYIGHSPYRKQLEELLTNSDGGAILVTGFRGVGKSTMVHNAISMLNANGNCRMIPISVVLPSEKTYGQVMVEIIRKLYETLYGSAFWNELMVETQARIRLAYNRTSLNIKHSRNMTTEGEFSMPVPLGWKPNTKVKSSKQRSEEKSFLTFSEQDVEYELTQCIKALNESNGYNRVVIVIDEIDKITSTEEGMSCFDNLLERMKNLISSIDALFVFVAGIDIYKRWEIDSQKINSLYDSLFNHHIYLPCIWDSIEDLFDVIEDRKYVYKPIAPEFRGLVQTEYTTILEDSFRLIGDYILFKGKGLPRRILGIFNDFVVWDGKQPCFMLTDKRIQAILLVSKLLKKFRSFTAVAKIATIYERDIYYTLFFSMLEFLIFQEKMTFTEEQIKKTLLNEQGPLGQFFTNALNSLLVEFEKLAFIKKTETGYEVIDDTILKQDQSLRVLDQDLLLHTKNSEQIQNQEDTLVDERFHDQIKIVNNKELSAFWDNYNAEQVIIDSKYMMMFKVALRYSGLQKYAVVYKVKKKVETERENRKIENLYSIGLYRFKNPCLLDTEDYIKDGMPVTSLRSIAEGYALAHLIEAKLEYLTIYQIIHQVLSFLDYLHNKGFCNVRLKPDNIIVYKDRGIKILDIKHICRLGNRGVHCVTRTYSAPEAYLSECSIATDFYSVGILLTEMITGKSLCKYYTERHIDVKTIVSAESCSQKLKDVLIKATAFDPKERYVHSIELLRALDECPEFRGMKKISIVKMPEGTVIGHDISDNPTIIYATGPFAIAKSQAELMNQPGTSQKLTNRPNDYNTVPLGHAYFDDYDKTILLIDLEPYLVRLSNNERIVLKNDVFRIGTKAAAVDYCLDNNLVSRVHAEFRQVDGAFYVIDLSSINGIYINSGKILPNQGYRIKNGDWIRIANEEFVFYEG